MAIISKEPSFFSLGEYIGFYLSPVDTMTMQQLSPLPCKDCRKVEENNKELVDTCLKIKRFGHRDENSCQISIDDEE